MPWKSRPLAAVLALAAIPMLLAAAVPAGAASIAAHRAIYDLRLVSADESASLSGVEGRLAFEVQGSSCEGWSVNFRMVNRFRPAEGEMRTVDTQSTSFESGDALDMRYNQKEYVERNLQAETKIKVSRPTLDAVGEGSLGDGKPFAVPAGAFLPMQHQMKLMDKAAKGETRDTSVVFDGSDGGNSYRAITFIGPRHAAGKNDRDIANAKAAALGALASWPISISYYPTTGNEQDTPSYQVGFDLYENGVATGLKLDYGNFVLGGDLANLEMLKSDPCN